MLRQGILRPSNLPKLKLCAWFLSENTEHNEATVRGTSVDMIYRQILTGLTDFPNGSEAEIAAADWAASQTDLVIGKSPVLARKEDCQVRIPRFPNPGEVDPADPRHRRTSGFR